MNRFLQLLLLSGIFLFCVKPEAAERVLDFHSAIQIDARGGLSVTETIAVQVEGREIRRGILRDFPTEYRDRYGNRVVVPFEVTAVKRDGYAEKFALERLANGARIRIGDAAVLLPLGRHVYEIRYRTARQVGFFSEHDELYWNVNGNGWSFAFERIAAEVRLPAPVPAARLQAEAYTGREGARGRDYAAEMSDGAASFRSTRAFGAREGMTIVFSFPKGIVSPPSLPERAGWFFRANAGAAGGAGGLLLLAAFLWWRWLLVGRDPREGPKFPRYEAPPGVGAAGARYVNRMSADDKCLAAALLGLGQRGFLRIRKSGGEYDIERTGATVDWLPGESALAGRLLPRADSKLHLGETHDPLVQEARDNFKQNLAAHFGERLFSTNRGSLAVGFLIAACSIGFMFVVEAPIFAIVLVGAAMAAILFLFSRWLPAYSVEGRRLEDAIVGLRLYLGVAEADELRRMKMPPQTKEEFAKFLPYAVALDVEKTWADRFARVIGAAAVAAAVADYYSSSSGSDDFTGMRGFASSLSGLGETISAASTPPGSSSGSSDSGGGGGSSGGGGGGGGGSGW